MDSFCEPYFWGIVLLDNGWKSASVKFPCMETGIESFHLLFLPIHRISVAAQSTDFICAIS